MSDIYWESFCGNESVYSAFWVRNLSIDTHNPDLTTCFQDTILTWIPCGLLWIASPCYYWYLRGKTTRNTLRDTSARNLLKTILGILLCFVVLLDLFKSISEAVEEKSPPPVDFVTPVIRVISMALATFFMVYEYRKGVISSGIVFFFWLLLVLFGIVPFRSKIKQAQDMGKVEDMFRLVTFYIYYALVLLEFLLHITADTSAMQKALPDERQPLLKGKKIVVQEARNACPEEKASFLSRITFTWLTPMIRLGYKRKLVFNDLYQLLHRDRCKTIWPQLDREWQKELRKVKKEAIYRYKPTSTANGVANGKAHVASYEELLIKEKGETKPKGGNPSFFLAIMRALGPRYAIAGVYKFVYNNINFLNPMVLGLLLTVIENNDPYTWKGYLYAVLLFVIVLIATLVNQQYIIGGFISGMQFRTAVIAQVYRKALRLSSASKKNTTVGQIVNLMSVDAERLQIVLLYFHHIWSAVYVIVLCMVFLWNILGPAILAGVTFLLLLIPWNLFIASMIKKLQAQQMALKDKRLKVLNEVLNGMKVLKLYAWEKSFQEKIDAIRNQELQTLKKIAYLNASGEVTWLCAPYIVSLVSFAVYVLSDENNILDANTAFVSLSLINLMNVPISLLSLALNFGAQAIVAFNRITKYLLYDEIDPSCVGKNPKASDQITVENATLSWGLEEEPVLRNLSFSIVPGSLVAVVGQVGSGKSSLMSALLGEMLKMDGTVNIRGSIAYVPQQAWIQNQTLEENILFGKQRNTSLYNKCIDACALGPDLKILAGGDQTEIGEKGINISGGQKQRVSLARAVYQDCDVYLLDDPLSAVDSHVGKHIFEKVIGAEGMLKDKTRILCTNGLTYLPVCDKIIVLSNNTITEMGTYQELMSHNGAFAEFLRTYLQNEEDSSDTDEETGELKNEIRRQVSILSGSESAGNDMFSDPEKPKARRRRRSRQTSRSKSVEDGETVKVGQKLTQVEEEDEGAIKLSVLTNYARAVGVIATIIVFISFALFMGSQLGGNVWLSLWSEDEPVNGTQPENTDVRLGVYGAFGAAQTIFVLIECFALATGTVAASGNLHRSLLRNILRAPMAFFDTTPLGRVLNRFSRDIDTVDVNIPGTLRAWLSLFSNVFGTLIIISYSTPYFLIVLVPLGICYVFIQRYYIATSRQLKRIDSVRKSPIFSHFGETLVGASSIRAYGHQQRFIDISDKFVDQNNMAWYPNINSYRWVAVLLEFMGSIIVLSAGLFAVISSENGDIEASTAGLSVTYALQATFALSFLTVITCDLEVYVVAAERVKEYTDVQSEAPWNIPATKPPSSWPDKGKVEFKNYSVRYRPGLDLVLKDVDFTVEPGEKVGIVGRTGAGKSSLTMALFRLMEAASGNIIIDGIDIATLGLHQIRSSITIIPQDPVIFSGNLRMNLDPFEQYSDHQLWQALEHSHLKDYVCSLADGLSHECTEGGENLSVGQRQLLCLARALLRNTKILILDEATAAVDLETDDLIQQTIRTEFKQSTVITIAHRLNTIMDYDRVLVLDKGKVIEYDSPQELLSNRQGIFYGMAKDAGLV